MPNTTDDLTFQVDIKFNEHSAIKQVDNLKKHIEERLKKGIDGLTKEDKKNVFSEVIYDGKEYLKLLYKINQKTGEVSFASSKSVSRDDLQKITGVDYKAIEQQVRTESKLNQIHRETAVELEINNELLSESATKTQVDAQNKELLSQKLKKLKDLYREVAESGGDLEIVAEAMRNVKEQMDALEPETLGKVAGVFQRLGNTVKRVAYYKLSRMILQLPQQIIRTFKEGFDLLAEFDDRAKKTSSDIQGSMDVIKGSLGQIFQPIMETIAPILRQIAIVIANIANGFARASAQAKGLSKYTKVNTEYMKNLDKATQSLTLSFDKFETLGDKADNNDLFFEADVDEALSDTEELGSKLYDVFQKIGQLLEKIWDEIEPMMPFFEKLIDLLLESIETIFSLLTGDWDGFVQHMKNTFLDTGDLVTNMLYRILNNLISSIMAPIKWIAKLFGKDIDIPTLKPYSSTRSSTARNVSEEIHQTVNSSAHRVPTLNTSAFTVDTTSSISTNGVVGDKLDTVADSIVYGISELLEQSQPVVVLNVDGAELARSQRFIDEVNRKNSGLNFK